MLPLLFLLGAVLSDDDRKARPRTFRLRERLGVVSSPSGALVVVSEGFEELQALQRDVPESMFHEKANPGASYSAVWQFMAEHVGDLIHRAAYGEQGGGWGYGWDAVGNKVDKTLRTARQAHPFASDDVLAQTRRNFRYHAGEGRRYRPEGYPETEEGAIAQLRLAGQRYADAYRRLVPLTWLQKQGRTAAVALGEHRWPLLVATLEAMQRAIAAAEQQGEDAMFALYYTRLPIEEQVALGPGEI